MNFWLDYKESLYDFMLEYLNHDRCCPDCGGHLWAGYSDGHVWDKCLNCSEPSRGMLEFAGYITDYPVPTETLPESLEVRDMGERWLPEHQEHHLPHEQYYRMKEPK